MTEPVETANVVTVSTAHAQRHLHALLAEAERGAVIRVLDLRYPKVKAYISLERPAALDGWPDDLEMIEARTRRRHSQQARERHEQMGRPAIGWHRGAAS
jgi:hypothetical protein